VTTQPDPDYAAHPTHPLARVPLGALLVVREYLDQSTLVEVDWHDPEDLRAVADALVAELAQGGFLRLVGDVDDATWLRYPLRHRVYAVLSGRAPWEVAEPRWLQRLGAAWERVRR
jgi:hypothetical protein